MDAFFTICAVVFGLIIGSFLNVVIYRLPRGEEMIWTRSRCPACGRMIAWYDNIPVVSFLFLLGRCRHCKSRISVRYPLVEILTGCLFGLAISHALAMPGVNGIAWHLVGFLLMAIFLAALVAATFIDLDHRILPDEITKTGMWVTPVTSLLFPWIISPHFGLESLGITVSSPNAAGFIGSLAGLVVGAGMIWAVAILGKMVFRKDAMGFGDVKFMGMIGGFLGPLPVILVFFAGCLFGSVVGVTIYAITRNRYMAFGPYLALGAAIMLFWTEEALWVVTEWWPRFLLNSLG